MTTPDRFETESEKWERFQRAHPPVPLAPAEAERREAIRALRVALGAYANAAREVISAYRDVRAVDPNISVQSMQTIREAEATAIQDCRGLSKFIRSGFSR